MFQYIRNQILLNLENRSSDYPVMLLWEHLVGSSKREKKPNASRRVRLEEV